LIDGKTYKGYRKQQQGYADTCMNIPDGNPYDDVFENKEGSVVGD
jgi:hypothetical protein